MITPKLASVTHGEVKVPWSKGRHLHNLSGSSCAQSQGVPGNGTVYRLHQEHCGEERTLKKGKKLTTAGAEYIAALRVHGKQHFVIERVVLLLKNEYQKSKTHGSQYIGT